MDRNQLKSFFTEHWNYMAVFTACKLNLFDKITEPISLTELSDKLKVDKENLLLLLNALVRIDFIKKHNLTYQLNETSMLLTEDHSQSLKYACLNWGSEHLNAWQNLDFSLKTGKSAFENIYHKSFFQFLDENPQKLYNYHRAMYDYALDDYKNISKVLPLKNVKSVMDVGGGFGAAINQIKSDNPNLDCFLFDLPMVIQHVNNKAINTISGDFFNEIPKVADVILLTRILHDWNDEKAKVILNNCYNALPNDGILVVVENCSDLIENDLSLLSLNMLTICESFERESFAYIKLCNNSGFRFNKQEQLNDLQTALIFTK